LYFDAFFSCKKVVVEEKRKLPKSKTADDMSFHEVDVETNEKPTGILEVIKRLAAFQHRV